MAKVIGDKPSRALGLEVDIFRRDVASWHDTYIYTEETPGDLSTGTETDEVFWPDFFVYRGSRAIAVWPRSRVKAFRWVEIEPVTRGDDRPLREKLLDMHDSKEVYWGKSLESLVAAQLRDNRRMNDALDRAALDRAPSLNQPTGRSGPDIENTDAAWRREIAAAWEAYDRAFRIINTKLAERITSITQDKAGYQESPQSQSGIRPNRHTAPNQRHFPYRPG